MKRYWKAQEKILQKDKKEEIAENHKPSAKIWNPVLVQQEGANKEVTARAGRV